MTKTLIPLETSRVATSVRTAPRPHRSERLRGCLAAVLGLAALAVATPVLAGPPLVQGGMAEGASGHGGTMDQADGPDGAGVVVSLKDPVAQAEILPGWRQADGTLMAALRLEMKPGWKTYWRAPGEAGIPPQLDWTGSDNLEATRILWPTPSVIFSNGRRSIGYRDSVVLPIVVAPKDAGKPVRLEGVLQAGICGTVCVPMQFQLSGELTGETAEPVPLIEAAMRHRPVSGAAAGVKNLRCRTHPSEDGLVVEARMQLPRGPSDEVVVFEYDDPDLWIASASVIRKGRELTAVSTFMVQPGSGDETGTALGSKPEPAHVDLSRLRLTILGKDRAIDLNGCPEARSLSTILRSE